MPKTRALLADAGSPSRTRSPPTRSAARRVVVPDRPLHPQPRGLVARRALGLQGAQGRRDPPGLAPAGRLRHRVPRQVPQRLRRPADARRQLGDLRRRTSRRGGPTGAAAVDGGPGPEFPDKDGGTYRFFNTTLNDNGEFYLDPGRYQTNVVRRPQPAADHRGQRGRRQPVLLLRQLRRAAPRPARRAGRPQADQARRRRDHPVRHDARPAEVRGRFDAVSPRRPGAAGEDDVSDKPFFISELPPLNAAEQAGAARDGPPAGRGALRGRRRGRADRRRAGGQRRARRDDRRRSPPTTATSSVSTASARARSSRTSRRSRCRCWCAAPASPRERSAPTRSPRSTSRRRSSRPPGRPWTGPSTDAACSRWRARRPRLGPRGAHRDRPPRRRRRPGRVRGRSFIAKDPGPTAQRFSQGVRTGATSTSSTPAARSSCTTCAPTRAS